MVIATEIRRLGPLCTNLSRFLTTYGKKKATCYPIKLTFYLYNLKGHEIILIWLGIIITIERDGF